MSNSPLIPMVAPDGTSADVPLESVQDAMAKGAKRAVHMVAPDGSKAYVPFESVQVARQAGAKPIWETQSAPPLPNAVDFAQNVYRGIGQQ